MIGQWELTLKVIQQLHRCEYFRAVFRLMYAQVIKVRSFNFPEELQILVSVKYKHGNVFLEKAVYSKLQRYFVRRDALPSQDAFLNSHLT